MGSLPVNSSPKSVIPLVILIIGVINHLLPNNEEQLHLEYSDNGKGIASKNLAKIFEPFFTTHRANGGLGMYIAVFNSVIQKLNGII
ncbi:MAG: hypothetical protein IMF12_11375 [Proteobacteria bacterium]|nr:hypothetical protein [Pseudomonadota bacterium]